MIITQTLLNALFTGFHAAFKEGFDTVSSVWPKIATEVPSTTAENTYGWLGSWPKLREWIGEREVQNIAASGYSLRNRKFESTVGFKADNIDDDQFGIYTPMMREMGRAAADHPNEIVFEALANGAINKCYDGVPFFSANHKVGKATISNFEVGDHPAWYLMDCSRALKPLIFQRRKDYRFVQRIDPKTSDRVFNTDEYIYGVDARVNAGYGFWQMAYCSKDELTRESLRDRFTRMSQLQDANGRKLNLRATHLVVPVGLEFAARDLVLASQNAAGATNTDYKLVEVISSPFVG